ncbi:THUMP domain-containing protein 1 [Geranomyces variabilis]|uniref:THUMP domain-containing protein 1 n=1 Tax=Geranomyces variabilis TaxID=109894 RepID=A0AAD5TQJ8_9FUNG|nr:THUMP domain-containing protein 1 [Geranomyces variabilis]
MGGTFNAKRQKIKRGLFATKGSHKSGASEVMPGMQGIYCFVTMDRETKAVSELRGLLHEYLERIYGPQESIAGSSSDEGGDVSDLLTKELAELKKAPTNTKQQFYWRKTNMDCVVFLQTYAPIEPAEFVRKVLTDLQETKIKKTRYTQRLHPIQRTCRPYEDDLKEAARPLLALHFEGKKGIKWAVEARVKRNSSIKREVAIDLIAGLVGPDHVVDLKNAEVTVIVEVLTNVCGISVVRDYQELRKFNLEEIHAGDAKKLQPVRTKEATATQQTGSEDEESDRSESDRNPRDD